MDFTNTVMSLFEVPGAKTFEGASIPCHSVHHGVLIRV